MSDAARLTEIASRLQAIASDLGVSSGCDLTLGGERVENAGVVNFHDVGGPRGLVWMDDQVRTDDLVNRCAAEGYGYSSWRGSVGTDAVSLANVFLDWGWTGSADRKPLWMRIAEHAVEQTREAIQHDR